MGSSDVMTGQADEQMLFKCSRQGLATISSQRNARQFQVLRQHFIHQRAEMEQQEPTRRRKAKNAIAWF